MRKFVALSKKIPQLTYNMMWRENIEFPLFVYLIFSADLIVFSLDGIKEKRVFFSTKGLKSLSQHCLRRGCF